MNKDSISSLRRISQEVSKTIQNKDQGFILSEWKPLNELPLQQFSKNKVNSSMQQLSQNQSNTKKYTKQLDQSQYVNCNEECLQDQDQEEVNDIMTHSLYTKRNSLVRDKENSMLNKQNYDNTDWKYKYEEIQRTLNQRIQQQFILERQINELQTKLVNEKNKNKFFENNQRQLESVQLELEQSYNKTKYLENQISFLIQQNDQLSNDLTECKSTIQKQKHPFKQIQLTSYGNNSQKNKSFDGRKSKSKDRLSTTYIEDRKQSDNKQIQLLQSKDLYNATQQNKNLLLKISEYEKQINFLLDKQFHEEQAIENVKNQNTILSKKLSDYTDILSQLGAFQQNNTISKKNNNNTNINNNNQYQNTLNQNRVINHIPFQKNDCLESVSDQQSTQKFSNFSQQIFIPEMTQLLSEQLLNAENREVQPQLKQNNLMKMNDEQVTQYRRNQLSYPYYDEIEFIQDNGENTNRLSKLCSC